MSTPASAPRLIKAYACFEPNGAIAPWQYESRPLGDYDVEIKISHCGICGSDLNYLTDERKNTTYPCVPGHEIVGTITAIGQSVTSLAIGDRAGVGAHIWGCLNNDPAKPCRECAAGFDQLCSRSVIAFNSKYEDGSRTFGGFAEYVRVLDSYAFKVPDAIPSEYAAPLMCAGVTVFAPMKCFGVNPGHRVGVIGIGGLGHVALQFVKAFGATPVAFSRSANKKEEAIALGGPTTEFYDLSDAEQAASALGSVDLLLVTAGGSGQSYDSYVGLVRKRGTIVVLGLPSESIAINPIFLVVKHVSVVGSVVGGIQDMKDMLEMAAGHQILPVIEKYPMGEVNTGVERVISGKVRYRVVLEN